jgi:diguanylate cyclase (GGDEF)-like protein
MPTLPQRSLALLGLLAATALLLFARFGEAVPLVQWSWVDIAAEGGLALLAAAWTWLVLQSRPDGAVTRLLGGGLAALALASWADALDELWRLPDTWAGLGWAESVLACAGVLLLTLGLVLWRQEQAVLNEHMHKRERLFRDHRALDRQTQLADAGYLRRQIEAEASLGPQRPCGVVLVDLPEQAAVQHEQGRAEAARRLDAVCHQLLLNLRQRDLLCRYAGDRLVVLMPDTPLPDVHRRAAHLARMVESMQFHARDDRLLPARLRWACALAEPGAQTLLSALNREVEGRTEAAMPVRHA